MKLSKALKQSTPTTMTTEGLAANRARMAYKHCAACQEDMQLVMGQTEDGRPVRWTWGSLWALGCDDHRPWLQAAADDRYVPELERQVEQFRAAYVLVETTIAQWQKIADYSEKLLQNAISRLVYLDVTNGVMQEMAPEMIDFDPEALAGCLQWIKNDGWVLSQKLKRATWEAPKEWTP